MYRRDLPHFSHFLRYSLLLLEVEAKQNQTHYFSVGVVFQYSIAIEEIMHWLYSVVNKEMAWFFSPRVHKGTTENKILPFLSQSAHPDYTKRTKKQSTYLEVYDFLSTVWNYYADKYNTVGIRHYLEINILEGHTSKKKKNTLPNTVKQMEPDQKRGKVECSKYWRLIPTFKEAIWV